MDEKSKRELRARLADTIEILKSHRNAIERLSLDVAAISDVLSDQGWASALAAKRAAREHAKHPLNVVGPRLYTELARRVRAI